MIYIVITCLLIAIIDIILIVLIKQYNKFQWYITKIKNSEKKIHTHLTKKYDILIKFIDFLKDDEELKNYTNINKQEEINELNSDIDKIYNNINEYLNNNEKILKEVEIIKLNQELENINININSSKKYHNKNVNLYNDLCHTFPANIIAKIYKYKDKELIDEDKKEELIILNDN